MISLFQDLHAQSAYKRFIILLASLFILVSIGFIAILTYSELDIWFISVSFVLIIASFLLAFWYGLIWRQEIHHFQSSQIILQNSLDAAPHGYLIVAPNGQVIYHNATFKWLCGPEATRSLTALDDLVDGDEQALIDLARLRLDAQGNGLTTAEIPVKTSVGITEKRTITVKPFTLQQNSQSSVGALLAQPITHVERSRSRIYQLWVVEDTTRRSRIETSLRHDLAQMKDLVENIPIGLYSVDRQGKFLFANRQMCEWVGHAQQELLSGKVRLRDILSENIPEDYQAHDPFYNAEGSDRTRVRLKSRRGQVIETRIKQTVQQDQEEEILYTRALVRRLSPRNDWEEALRRSEQRFERIFEEAPVGIVEIDAEGVITASNNEFRNMVKTPTGKTRIGFPIFDLIDEEDVQIVKRGLQNVHQDFLMAEEAQHGVEPEGEILTSASSLEMPRKRARIVAEEVRLIGKNAPTVSLYISENEDKQTGASGYILHIIDVTEQKKLEQQFAHSQKMQAVGQLAGGIAHDFNNLLTAMIGFCDLLLMRHQPNEQSFADINQIKQNANRAANLVRQLLAFSRQQSLQPKVLNITDVLSELLDMIRRLIGEHVELHITHGRDLFLVRGDQGQLEQVIVNLVVNAKDAMTESGTLHIETTNVSFAAPTQHGSEELPSGDYVMIEVRDTGCGIDKEVQERIFEPFFSTKEVGSGTGLGLSTVYGIVKQTGGFIFVDSVIGVGTTFNIYFPAYRQEKQAENALPKLEKAIELVPAKKDLTGIGTIMLVEDEDPVRIIGTRALQNKGYHVIQAVSGTHALEVLAEQSELKIDLLITDVVMPQMDGPALIQEVRKTMPNIKVIYISGYAEDDFRERLVGEEELCFLPKPFTLPELAEKVKEVLTGEA